MSCVHFILSATHTQIGRRMKIAHFQRKEAKMARMYVATILREYPIEVIYASSFRRAYETISPLAEQLGLSIFLKQDLRERKLGNGVFEDFFKAVEATWRNPAFAHPGGESSLAAQQRGSAVVEHLLEFTLKDISCFLYMEI